MADRRHPRAFARTNPPDRFAIVPARRKQRTPKMMAHIGRIKNLLLDKGWKEDRYGHMHKKFGRDKPGDVYGFRHYRFKFGPGSLRREVKVGNMWVRLRSAPYGKIRLTEDGKLAGLKS